MQQLTDLDVVAQGNADDIPDSIPGADEADLGPYNHDYRFNIVALFYNGAEVGERSDRSFNRTDLEIPFELRLDKGNTARLRIQTENSRATLEKKGFRTPHQRLG